MVGVAQPTTPKTRARPAPAAAAAEAAAGTPKVRKISLTLTDSAAAAAKGKPPQQAGDKAQAAAAKPAQQASASKPPQQAGDKSQVQTNEFTESLDRAMEALRPGGFTGRLPCRDAEQDQIATHLRVAVKQGGSMQVLYISGMPGTGKTASVLDAIAGMRATKGLPAFCLAHVNAMRLGAPGAVFSNILGQLPCGGGRVAASAAHGDLARFFSERSPKDPVVVLLIDEIDHLVTSNQAVLYKLFDWLALPAPRLVVVAISNTMDLPERLLPRVASRFGIVRVDFEPYNRDQINRILVERLQGHDAVGCFAPTMLRLCSARVAAGTGDIRKALQLCRRAAEVRAARHRDSGPVGLPDLEAAEKDLLHANPAAKAIGGLGMKARRFLLAYLLELRKTEGDVVPLQTVTSRYKKVLTAIAGEDPRAGGASNVAAALQQMHPLDEAAFLAQRLQAMALLRQQPVPGGSGAAARTSSGPLLALGADLDAEDLATALKAGEDNEGVLELLHESRRN